MSHPPPEQLEAAAFGWLPAAEVRAVRAHADGCPTCGPALRQDETVQRRLSLLRGDEPRVELTDRVLARLEHSAPAVWVRPPVRLAVVAVALLLAGLLVASNGHLRRTAQRVGARLAL